MYWNASNYRSRKAKRLAAVPPRWVQNPETEEWFFLRKVGAMAPMLAGMMPSALTAYALGQWRDGGLEGVSQGSHSTPPIEETQRDMKLIASVVGKACVIPILVHGQPERANYDPTFLEQVMNALTDRDPDFNREEFIPESVTLDPEELDDADLLFIFKYASNQVGDVELKGGEVISTANFQVVPKKPGRRSRSGDDLKGIQKTA